MKHRYPPVHMEEHFSPGFFTSQSIHIGSQSMRFYENDEKEQAIENVHLALGRPGDVTVLRNMDPDYIAYWKILTGEQEIINIETKNKKDFLSNVILGDKEILQRIKKSTNPAALMRVYFPTDFEAELADNLGIGLHGTVKASSSFGTKTGIRKLAEKSKIPMPEGYICSSHDQAQKAIVKLFEKYEQIVIKHDLSSAGRFIKVLRKTEKFDVNDLLDELSGGKFDGKSDRFVVEAWIANKASICAHIEISRDKEPYISAGWQQIIGSDGITYMGAGPLHLSKKALASFKQNLQKLALALKKEDAVGSFGPDFIITENTPDTAEDSALLIELNARIPFTAFPLAIVKKVKGSIGSGFLATNIELKSKRSFNDLASVLKKNKLLITKPSQKAYGVVPYNITQLEWNTFYFVAIAPTYQEAVTISEKVRKLFTD